MSTIAPLSREQQRDFVCDLMDSVKDDVLNHIEKENIPDHWDGHELRALLADRLTAAAGISAIRKYPRSARAKDYANYISTHPAL